MSCRRWYWISLRVHSQHTLMRNVNTARSFCSVCTTWSHSTLFACAIKNLEKDCFSVFNFLWTWITELFFVFSSILRWKYWRSFNLIKSKVIFTNIFSQSHVLYFWANVICAVLKQLRSLFIHRIFNFQVLIWRGVIKVNKFTCDEFGPIHIFEVFLPSLHFTLNCLPSTLVLYHFFIDISKIMRQ